MKKLLAILSTISIIPSTLPIMAISYKLIVTRTYKAYSLDSFKNIIRIINDKFQDNSKHMGTDYMDKLLDGFAPIFYAKSINDKLGEVVVWSSQPRNDTAVIKNYENTYINHSNLPQKRLTQSRTETISETHSFSVTLSERISTSAGVKISGKIRVPIAEIKEELEIKFGVESKSEKSWNESKTTTISETVPSQEILQNPHTTLHVNYKVSQGTWDYNAITRFKIDDMENNLFRIPLFYFSEKGTINYIVWNNYSIKETLEILKEYGYSDQLNLDQKREYSIISVDNIENPKKIFVNLPITWNSPTSGFTLDHYEEPLEEFNN